MPNTETEIEYKFDAKHVTVEDLTEWAKNTRYARYLEVEAPDHYYGREGSDHVVRHRLLGGAGELTVKTRKSIDSTVERQEIDLRFAQDITVQEVDHFLTATGWQREFTINKHAHIWWFEQPKHVIPVSLALYDSWKESKNGKKTQPRRFLEVEIEKGTPVSDQQARKALDVWKQTLQDRFILGEPMSLSLYELYSSRKYRVI